MKFWNWKESRPRDDLSGGDESKVKRTLFLNGIIAEESWWGDEVTPGEFRDELNAEDGDIIVVINSPGGDVFAAAQIYNMLKEYPGNVTVSIDSLAASAASVIAMAGNTVIMSPVSMIMIHNPSTLAFGDSDEMERAKNMLDEVKESIINAYEEKTGQTRKQLAKLMDEETYMNANRALELGFCDQISSKSAAEDRALNVQALYDGNLRNKIVAQCTASMEPEETPEPEDKPAAVKETTPESATEETPSDKPDDKPDASASDETGRSAAELRERLALIKNFI